MPIEPKDEWGLEPWMKEGWDAAPDRFQPEPGTAYYTFIPVHPYDTDELED